MTHSKIKECIVAIIQDLKDIKERAFAVSETISLDIHRLDETRIDLHQLKQEQWELAKLVKTQEDRIDDLESQLSDHVDGF